MKEHYSGVFLVVVTTLRLELLDIAQVAVYLATPYVQTTTNMVVPPYILPFLACPQHATPKYR